MKSKTPPFEELINRLVICIQKREPEKVIGDVGKEILSAQWKSKPKELHKMVKLLEIQEFRQQDELLNKRAEQEYFENHFQLGCDILGNPIICVHRVLFKNEYLSNNRKSSNYRKLKDPNKYFFQQEIVKQW